MSNIKPRAKWVADFPHARLSYAEVATIIGNEVMAGKLGRDVRLRWFGEIDEIKKNDLLFSVLDRGHWSMYYPNGGKTCYKFASVKWHDPDLQKYDYMVWTNLGSDHKTITMTVFRLHSRTRDDESRDNIIATIDLDFEYLDSLGALHYDGTDEEWGKVED